MKLNQNTSDDVNLIKSVTIKKIVVDNTDILQSCIVCNTKIISDLRLFDIKHLSEQHIEQLLSTEPEIIIFGSGIIHTFPEVALLNPIASQNIGFEVMNNKSAARTYNILVAEDRKVACLLIIS